MYVIPQQISKYTLVDFSIQQIVFSQNLISIYFDSKNWINTFGFFETVINNKTSLHDEICPVCSDLGLLALLEKKIIKTEISDDRKSLTIYFEDDSILIFKSNEFYESFELIIDNLKVII